MKRNTWIVTLFALAVSFCGCKINLHRGVAGSGHRKTETRELKSFNAIATSGAYEVNLTCQKPAGFEIEADDNILPLIRTEVRDGILFVSDSEQYHESKLPVLRITLPELNSVANHGAGASSEEH